MASASPIRIPIGKLTRQGKCCEISGVIFWISLLISFSISFQVRLHQFLIWSNFTKQFCERHSFTYSSVCFGLIKRITTAAFGKFCLKSICDKWGRCASKLCLFQAIGIAIQRGNTSCVMGTGRSILPLTISKIQWLKIVVVVKSFTLYHIERKGATIFDIAVRFLSLLRLETVSSLLTLVKNGDNIFTKFMLIPKTSMKVCKLPKRPNPSSNKQTTPANVSLP